MKCFLVLMRQVWGLFAMRLVMIVTLLLLASLDFLSAQSVSVSEAKAKAIALRTKNYANTSKPKIAETDLVYTSESKGLPTYYVFDYSDGGFAIIGADQKAKIVLGYCEQGQFDYDSIPDGLKYMLNAYNDQILEAKADPKSDYFLKESQAAAAKASISPMVKTTWGQDYPFNCKIPMAAGSSSRFVTGCGATAMAQILKFYNSPTKGKGSKSYTIDRYLVGGVNRSVTFRADFQNTTYEWSKMLNTYSSGSYTSDQANAVGVLMYHVGVALETEFAWNGSSSWTHTLIPAFVDYFDYNPNAILTSRSNYTNAEWESLVYNELSAGHPVWYRGTSQEGGHAFVCDGYDGANDTYHINWGWNGYCDGYFPLTGSRALDPYRSSTGSSAFVDTQMATVGLMPSSMLVPVTRISLSSYSATLTHGSTKKITATITPSNATVKGVTWSSDNIKVATVSSSGVVTAVGVGKAKITCSATDGSGVIRQATITVTSNLSSRGSVVTKNTAGAEVSFSTDGQYEWDWDSTNKRLVSTNKAVPHSTSLTTVKITTNAATKLSFDYFVSSEENCDLFYLVLDDSNVLSGRSGRVTGSFSTSLAKGHHELKLYYWKDSSVDGGDDIAAISNMQLTLPSINVSSITLSATTASLLVGATKKLTATIKPSDATNKNVKWTSSNTAVATVSSSGTITAKSAGSCTITCTAADGNGAKATCKVTVLKPVTSIALNYTNVTIKAGAYKTLTATVSPSDASDKSVTWTSSKTSVATVSSSGKVTAVSPGTTTIKCKANDGSGKYKECAVTVEPLAISETAPTIAKGTYGPKGISFNKYVSAGKYYPWVLPYGINTKDYTDYFKAYVPLGMALYQSSGTLLILFKEVTSGTISAKQPFVAQIIKTGTVKLVNNAEVKISTLTNPSVKSLEVYNFNAKTGLMSLNTDFSIQIGGTYSSLSKLDSKEYLSMNTSTGAFSGITSLVPFRFYLIKHFIDSQKATVRNIAVSFVENEETAIEMLMNEEEEVVLYNMNGQRINQEENNGIFIKNGKKYIKK